MSARYAKKDIYSKDGILLYAKGQELTPWVVSKLREMGLSKEISQFSESQEDIPPLPLQHTNDKESGISAVQKTETIAHINKLKKAFQKATARVEMDVCTEVLNSVLFADNKQPWHLYIVTLWHHGGWLYTHSIDVALISLLIAYELGYRDNRLTEIGIGTLLHDIGKVLIPKSILNKKEKDLTTQETLILKQHCELGCDMVQEAGLSEICRNIILQHHERMDGSGYPRGLTASSIAPEAQICIVADAIDLKTSFHPKNPDWLNYGYASKEEVKRSIYEIKGKDTEFPKDLLAIVEKCFKKT
jgi:putative nucleotidyltransferase with HDIG domain